MKLTPASLDGAWVIEAEPVHDGRGFFARLFARQSLQAVGVDFAVEHLSMSFNRSTRTLRGIHFQETPFGEQKLIRCTRGRLLDVLVDLRDTSPTYGSTFQAELCPEQALSVFAPRGVAHGFLTLEPNTEVEYLLSGEYAPDRTKGIRWDDPGLRLDWPASPLVISERDRQFPNYRW